jgi:hypothetical protein
MLSCHFTFEDLDSKGLRNVQNIAHVHTRYNPKKCIRIKWEFFLSASEQYVICKYVQVRVENGCQQSSRGK